MKKKLLGLALVLFMALWAAPQLAFAEPDQAAADDSTQPQAKRTILLYCCGADLESASAMATHNFKQILDSEFSSDDDINFIVMTGGSREWQLDNNEEYDKGNEYLSFPEGVNVPKDAVKTTVDDPDSDDPKKKITIDAEPTSRISNVYNQIWEARGADDLDYAVTDDKGNTHGKLVLLDGDGLTGAEGTAVMGEKELMTDPETLKAFINYGVANYPAEKYDLILWDHGGGPQGGYGSDEHYDPAEDPDGKYAGMSFGGIVDALRDNNVTKRTDDDPKNDANFDFVDFDACLMGNLELALVLADYTDYYIASADTEPGYGQCYGGAEECKGWLNELGDSTKDEIYNADDGSFALGKVIADDMYEYYSKDSGPGSGDSGTLAVYDTAAMISNPEFQAALTDLVSMLNEEAEGTGEGSGEGEILFYDELRSYFKSINYSGSLLYDLADMVAFLGVADSEAAEDTTDYTNKYSELAGKFSGIFRYGDTLDTIENDFMYARCTLNEKTEENYYYDGDAEGKSRYGSLFSTGLTVFFPDGNMIAAPLQYCDALNPVIKTLPEGDWRSAFLKSYKKCVLDYGLILYTGYTVGNTLNDERAFYPNNNPYLGKKDEMNADVVMKVWKDDSGVENMWEQLVSEYLKELGVSEADFMPWLRKLVDQMAKDAMITDGFDVTKEEYEGKDGYKVEVKQGNKRIFGSVERNVAAELPVLDESIAKLKPRDQRIAKRYAEFTIGTIEGINDKDNIWQIQPLEEKWYAINDAEGTNHVAMIYRRTADKIGVPVLIGSEEDGKEADRLVMMEFAVEPDENDSHSLKSLYFFKGDSGPRRIDPQALTGELTVTPILYPQMVMSTRKFYLPISKASFTISGENASSITLDYAKVGDIPDIEDTNKDGKPLTSTITVTDLYGCQMDISGRVNETLKHISQAEVKSSVYNGKEQAPVVTCDGKTLTEGVDYTWEKVADVIGEGENERFVTPAFKNAREYEVLLEGKGEYTGFSNTLFVIKKAANPLKVKAKTAKVKYKKLKKKTQKLTRSKVIKTVKKGQGKVTYTKVKVNKKKYAKKFIVNKKTGKITVKKGVKKGTYKVTVKVSAAGNSNYKAAAKKVTVRIKVR